MPLWTLWGYGIGSGQHVLSKVDAYWALVQDLVPATDITCLTLHPGFDACCLNPFSLQVAYLNFRQEHGAIHASRAEYVYTRLIYNTIILPYYYYPPYTNTCQFSTQLTNCQKISIWCSQLSGYLIKCTHTLNYWIEWKLLHQILLSPHSRQFRYTAYRQVVRWAHGFLGREIRKAITACIVAAIRRQFPEEGGTYRGFKWPAYGGWSINKHTSLTKWTH